MLVAPPLQLGVVGLIQYRVYGFTAVYRGREPIIFIILGHN
jgi:hypothetical protein